MELTMEIVNYCLINLLDGTVFAIKCTPIGQWGKILVMAVGFVGTLGLGSVNVNNARTGVNSEDSLIQTANGSAHLI